MMMKRIATSFLLSLFQVVMIFTLTLAPVPFMDRVNAVYADDDSKEVRDDCEDDENADGSPRVYKPGCDFNDALTKAGDQSTTPGLVGVIEQFVAAAFGLAAINSVVFTQHPMAQVDCPGYMNPNITLRMMQAGSLAYIVGNIQSNQKFKSAAKDAVDIELTPQAKRDETADDEEQAIKNREFNQKQLDAYMALIKVYEAKVEALETKKNMAMLAELAYLAALGTEVVMTSGHAGKCTAGTAADTENELTITSTLQLIETTAAGVSAGPTAALCADAAVASAAKLTVQAAAEASTATAATTNASEDTEEDSTDKGFISKLFASFISVFTLGVAGFFASNTSPYSHEVSEARLQAEVARNTTLFGTITAEQTTASASVISTALDCPVTAATVATFQTTEGEKAITPYICCGSRVSEIPTGFSIVTPAPGKIWIEKDVIFPPIPGSAKNQNLDYVKKIAMGFVQQYQTELIQNSNISPSDKIVAIKKMLDELEYMDHNFDAVLTSPEFKTELASILNDSRSFDIETENGLNHFLSQMKQNFLDEAHAGFLGEALGLGIKMLALQFAMGGFMRNTALKSPSKRAWTFGIMAAVNLGVMKFNGKSAKEAKNRLEIVKDEARAFAESHALTTDFDEKLAAIESSSKSGLSAEELAKLNALGQRPGVVTCADPKGNSFVPAQCPSNLRPSGVNFALDSESKRRLGSSPLGQALPLLSDAVAGVGNGSTVSSGNGGTASGSIAQLGNLRNGIIKQVDGLVDQADKDLSKPLTDRSNLKPLSLAASNGRFRSLFNGDPAKNGVTKDMLAGVSGGLAEIEKLKDNKENKTASKVSTFTPPKFVVPKTKDFNFDIGGSNNTGANMAAGNGSGNSLDDFQVNAGDVNQKADVSIFRIISNRYLKSYPVLLEEKK